MGREESEREDTRMQEMTQSDITALLRLYRTRREEQQKNNNEKWKRIKKDIQGQTFINI